MKIVLYGHPTLRKVSTEVTEINDEVKETLSQMVDKMREANGVGLAAPQVGILKRILVIDTGEDGQKLEMINPKITKLEKEVILSEGCLSFPEIFR